MNYLSAADIYRKEPFLVRRHIAARARLCPFGELLPYFPATGAILDVGCGYGYFLHALRLDEANKGRRLLGLDHDKRKIDIAKKYSLPGIEFSAQPVDALAKRSFDVVCVVDVLYCIPKEEWAAFIGSCFSVLKDGGFLLLKEVIKIPGWKNFLISLEEKLAVEVLKITQGAKPHLEPKEIYERQLETAGFTVREARLLNKGYTANHCLFVAVKRGTL